MPQQSPNYLSVPDMERIVSDYGTQLLRLCFLYLKDTQLAEDAVQDTFIKVYRSYASFTGGSTEKTWITRIAINVCKDMLRNVWHSRVDVTDDLGDIPYEDKHEGEDDRLVKEIMKLKPRYKEVILLFYYEDMKTSDIAKALGCPLPTVGVRLKRAREILKISLEGDKRE